MRLSGRDTRAIVVGAIVVAAAVFYAAVAGPLRRVLSDLEGRRDVAAEFLQRYRAVVAASATYAAAAETANARLSRLLPETFPGDPQVSVNELLEMLEKAAVQNDVRIMRTSPLPVDSTGPELLGIGATVECESDLAGLLGLLRLLETGDKLFHISGLHVATAGAGASGKDIATLRFGFTVRAFVVRPLRETHNAKAIRR